MLLIFFGGNLEGEMIPARRIMRRRRDLLP
jgi:hypothetical protein